MAEQSFHKRRVVGSNPAPSTMKILEIKSVVFPEVKAIKFERFFDERGFFTETFRKSQLDFFSKYEILQANISYSSGGVIRGLHFQWKPDQGKLVRVISGLMIDLFLDIRKGSPTFGKIGAIKLENDFKKKEEVMLWIPPGFAHGFAALKTICMEYYCTAEYVPGHEAGIRPLAQDIDWSLSDLTLKKEIDEIAKEAVFSEKDKIGCTLCEWIKDPRSENYIY